MHSQPAVVGQEIRCAYTSDAPERVHGVRLPFPRVAAGILRAALFSLTHGDKSAAEPQISELQF